MPFTFSFQSLNGSLRSDRRPSAFLQASHLLWLFLVALIGATVMVAPAYSAVSLRVEARPVSAPINALVTVTDANGNAVRGLTAPDFSLFVDGFPVPTPSFSLPVAQDVGQNVSVVFTMDYSSSVQQAYLAPMQDAVIAFINSMGIGDYAAIVKFNGTGGASVVRPFTRIDGAAGTAALITAVNAPYPGSGSNIFDAVLLSVQQLTTPASALPSGPKAIILISDGAENSSSADLNSVVNAANTAKIGVFTVGIGNFSDATSQQILTGLAGQTSAKFYPAPTVAQIGEAYVQVSTLLNNEYLLKFQSSIVDCNPHTIEVRVTGQAAAAESFTRCTPLFVPDVRGMTRAAAATELTTLGLVLGPDSQQASTTVPAGSVVSVNPVVGAVVTPGSTVSLVVSSGPPSSGPPPATGGGAMGPFELVVGLMLFAALLASRKRTP